MYGGATWMAVTSLPAAVKTNIAKKTFWLDYLNTQTANNKNGIEEDKHRDPTVFDN